MANRTLPRLLQAPAVINAAVVDAGATGNDPVFSFIRYVLNACAGQNGPPRPLRIGEVWETISMC